jgi:GntR family histidine utilization transcriptional repressor
MMQAHSRAMQDAVPKAADRQSGTTRRDEIRAHILDAMASGALAAGDRAPSEHELVARFGVSRMTAHHALKSLSAEGYLTRTQGVGTFVAPPRAHVFEAKLLDIADEIAGRGHRHSAEVLVHEVRCASLPEASAFGMAAGAKLLHAIVLHREDGAPIQLEDRLVDPQSSPGVIDVDPTSESYFAFLMRAFPYPEGDCVIRAVTPDLAAARRLELAPGQPCLQVERITRARGRVLTIARLLYPAQRHVVAGEFVPPAAHRPTRDIEA